jgi:predicted unusual protein kinase regulating ubiquinone biosynthesis (AarF/ABC1/UbiB family)
MLRVCMGWSWNISFPQSHDFYTDRNTLVEEHIPGIPGDQFIRQMMNAPETNKIRLSKEFVKFNERCYVRLLGDMRSYNFVVDITPDIEDYQYRISVSTLTSSHMKDKKFVPTAILPGKLSIRRIEPITPE